LATAAKTSAKSKPRSKPASAKSPSAKLPKAKSPKAKSASAKPASAKIAVAKPAPDSVDYLLKQVLTALDELKAKDVHEIDVRGKTSIADILVIASGTSTRHVKSLADEVVRFAKKAGMFPLGVEGQREAEWVLVDLGDIIVHVMLPRIREFYGLERLWTVGDDMPMAANAD
jgi:ribosome silencing factor RsfS/YbeB/iojap